MLNALVATLRRSVGPVTLIETHISAVLLAGERAYKLKKPVDLGFLDFTGLRQRRHFCREELRLNRRLAPDIYLSVLPITGSVSAPRLGGSGRVIDYAVEMRRFSKQAQFDHLLASGHLEGAHIDALAECIAAFHQRLPPAPVGSPYGRPGVALQAARDRYLQATGDYDGVPLSDYFEVYRALVRAKVARLRAAGAQAPGGRFQALRECVSCLRLAEALTGPRPLWLGITHGLAGAGKTHYADWLVERLPVIRLRSDVERKRLLGLAAAARTGSGIDQGAYRAKVTAATYRHLARLARRLLAGGWPVLVDASFLAAGERQRFARLAARLGVPFRILACSAPPDVLRERVGRRAALAGDASEADLAVLDAQRARYQPLDADEQALAIVIDTSRPYAVPGLLDAV